jgi:hypothetical protein
MKLEDRARFSWRLCAFAGECFPASGLDTDRKGDLPQRRKGAKKNRKEKLDTDRRLDLLARVPKKAQRRRRKGRKEDAAEVVT